MKTLRSLTCIAVISALCACGQKPDEPAAQQQQASLVQASTAETPQPQPEPVAPSAPAQCSLHAIEWKISGLPELSQTSLLRGNQ